MATGCQLRGPRSLDKSSSSPETITIQSSPLGKASFPLLNTPLHAATTVTILGKILQLSAVA